MYDCIVIGAGPGGIVSTKELLEIGSENVLCLEQEAQLGGVFADSYENLILTSSVTFSMFSDFWVGEGMEHHFWSKDEAITYWSKYADYYNVTDHIRFNARVIGVTETKEKHWHIQLHSGDELLCKNLILAIGNNRVPRYPEWHDQLTNISYSHSKDYRNADSFRGKRVLIVGGGESGSDVAYEIAKVADQSWVSLRESTGWVVPRRRGTHAADVSTHRGIWDLPREFGAKLSPFVLKLERARQDPVFDALADLNDRVKAHCGIWGIYGTKTLALPKAIAHHDCTVVDDIIEIEDGGRKLVSSDGQVLESIDHIVFCTGFHNQVQFMPEGLQACDPRKLYKHMFHPEIGSRLAWIGWARPAFGSQFPIMEMQARLCALVLAGEHKLPSPAEISQICMKDEQAYLHQYEGNAVRIRSLVDYHRYMNDLAKIIKCFPPLTRYFFTHPKLWLHLIYGPTQGTQFRLRGPGKKENLARDIIYKLPVSTFNHIVKAGLKGRLRHGLGIFNQVK